MKKLEPLKSIGLQLPESLFADVQNISILEDRSISAVVRIALRDFVTRYRQGLPVMNPTEKESNETER